MSKKSHQYNRRSIRLKGYDYSQAGMYFITICVQNRVCLFREMTDILALNDAGEMVEKWYWELENKFLDIKCHEMIIMPNHFHCIVENIGTASATSVGADLCVCPDESILGESILGEHTGSPLHRVVQWFKTMTTNEYIRGVKTLGWQPFNGKLWQRNYYEHIIRNDESYQRISEYIINNPKNWEKDKLNLQ